MAAESPSARPKQLVLLTSRTTNFGEEGDVHGVVAVVSGGRAEDDSPEGKLSFLEKAEAGKEPVE